MEINPDVHAEAKSKGWDSKQWVSLIPYGVNQAHPNAYKDILRCVVQNRELDAVNLYAAVQLAQIVAQRDGVTVAQAEPSCRSQLGEPCCTGLAAST